MHKTIKKRETALIKALTAVCERSKTDIDGFSWLTHEVNHDNFPASLLVTCVFDTAEQRIQAEQAGGKELLQKRVQQALLEIGVIIKHPHKHVMLDDEEQKQWH